MIKVEELARELTTFLPMFYTNLISENIAITNIVKSGSTIIITSPNHGILPGQAIVIRNVKYKFPIKKIKYLDKIFNKSRFLIEMENTNHPIVDSIIQNVEIGGVITDNAYNGSFKLSQNLMFYDNNPKIFGLSTTNNITVNEILNEGYILYDVFETDDIKNAINGYKIPTIIDNNTLSFSLNDVSNKKEYEILDFDFSNAQICKNIQVNFGSYEDWIIENTLNRAPNLYKIFVEFTGGETTISNGDSTVTASPSSSQVSTYKEPYIMFANFSVYICTPFIKSEQSGSTSYIANTNRFESNIVELQQYILKLVSNFNFSTIYLFNSFRSKDPIPLPFSGVNWRPIDGLSSFFGVLEMPFKTELRIENDDLVQESVYSRIQGLTLNANINNTNTEININYEN